MQQQPIRINQTGYSSRLPVHIAVLGEGALIIRDSGGIELFRQEVPAPSVDPSSGDPVSLVSPGMLPAGEYTAVFGPASRTFTVSDDVWDAVSGALIKGLYFQRCGCALLPEHAGPWTHAACHTAPAADWERPEQTRLLTGGWHDAGDYGKYVAPGAVTVAHLLYAWKLFPRGCSEALNIPETGSGVPDILSEARYELEWILKMQRADGAFHHKLTKSHFAPFIMPENDTDPEYVMPVSGTATGSACACLALSARVWRGFDSGFAERMLRAAESAWSWLKAHPDNVPFRNPEGVRTGQYGDWSDLDERFWAACELYAATGEAEYLADAETLYGRGIHPDQFGWADVGGLGALCCLFDLGEEAGEVLYTKLREDLVRAAEGALALSGASGYGTSLPPQGYIWGSILPIMSHAMTMIAASLLTGREDMRDAALLQWDYALGLNALDISFVTGFGVRSVRNPHHRPSGADGVEDPVPGLISGGPNKNHTYPVTREKLGEDLPPARYFLDITPSADTNEIAIYWNSPAVFVSAYLRTLARPE